MRSFASDNNSGAHPAVLDAIVKANVDHCVGYGDDPWTERAVAKIKEVFGQDCDPYFVFLGTGANVLSIKALCNSWEAVLCSAYTHANRDECGAPENLVGCKLLSVPGKDAKITPEELRPLLRGQGNVHTSQPRMVTITQSTELGTLYSPEEIRALADFAHENGLLLHMDGARISNACAALNMSLREMTRDLGVDVLSFGGTKNGLLYGEAVIFFDPELSREFPYIRKQGMQLCSKMRFISAQFEALLTDELWKKNAEHANAMAQKLADSVKDIPGVSISRPVETNGVFAIIPEKAIAPLQGKFFFYVWDAERSEVRWMASFDTTEEDILSFSSALRNILETAD